jgi:hypothetical protein
MEPRGRGGLNRGRRRFQRFLAAPLHFIRPQRLLIHADCQEEMTGPEATSGTVPCSNRWTQYQPSFVGGVNIVGELLLPSLPSQPAEVTSGIR